MALNASDVSPGDDILAAHNNALIDDIEQHDHDGVDTSLLALLSVDTGQLAASAVETAKINNDAVDKDKIAADVAGNGLDQNSDGSLEITDYSAGDILLESSDADTAQSIAAVYTKCKEIYLVRGGTLRIKFDLMRDAAGEAFGRIYRNGSPVGTERSTFLGDPGVTYSEDIAGWSEGDLCQLYCKNDPGGGGNTVKARNFRLYSDVYYDETVTQADF